MNNYANTEKSLKRFLKTKVKVTMATVVGFLIAGTVAFGAESIPTDGKYTNDILLNVLQSTKFAVGQNGKLEIYSNGSVGYLLSDLQQNHSSLKDIQNALNQQNKHEGYVVLTGALAGQGKYDGITSIALNTLSNKGGTTGNLAKALKRFNTKTNGKVTGDVTTIIGDKTNSPVVLGLIGGDFNANIFYDKTTLERTEGNTSVTINNGNVFGATAGSVSISAGNTTASYGTLINNIKINSTSEITLNGNTALNINGPSNGAGLTAGGLAAAIGGVSTSNVNGNSTINIASTVDGDKLEGITAGIFGGGMAVSTLGGTANANTTGKTDVTIKDGFSIGVAGGGLAVSTDASQYLKPNNGENYEVKQSGASITISKEGLNNGGTSTVNSGDIDVNLTGKTAAVVVGNGVAVSHQNSPQDKAPTDTDKISTSAVNAKNITVNVDLEKNLNGEGIGQKQVIAKVKKLVTQLENVITPGQGTNVNNLIDSMQETVKALKDGGIAVGVAGNGIAIAADKGVSTVKAENTTTNLNGGYIVGVAGNGIVANNAWAKSTAEVTGKSTINIDGADTEVIGVTGNGLAVYYGTGNYDGSLNFDGMAKAIVKDSEINIKNGSADGVFGGGIAIDDSELNEESAVAETTGISTINVTGGYVKDFGYEHLGGLITGKATGEQNYASYFNEVKELGDGVAIVAGGVAAGNMAKAHVANSVVNISGGKVEGDILAGGLATKGATSTVGTSTINITGGEIIGSVYGTGKATEEAGKSTVTTAGTATVEKSILNIKGYKNELEKIADFTEVYIGEGTELTIKNNIEVKDGSFENTGTIIFNNEDNGDDSATLISLGTGSVTNKGTIALDSNDKIVKNENGSVENTGKIKITDKTVKDLKDFDVTSLFEGEFTTTGMLVDKDGNLVLTKVDTVIGGDLSADDINGAKNDNGGKIIIDDGATIVGSTDDINRDSLNIGGKVTVKNEGQNGVTITDTEVNLPVNGTLNVGDSNNKADLTITGGTVNGEEGKTAIDFAHQNSTLTLDGTNVTAGNIGGEDNTNGTVKVTDSTINGDITAGSVKVGDTEITESFWNLFNGNGMLAMASAEKNNSSKKSELNDINTDSLLITENSIYNGNVTVNGKEATKTLAIMNSNAEFNKNVTVANQQGILIGAIEKDDIASARFNGNVKADKIQLKGNGTIEAYYASNITMLSASTDKDTTGTTITGGTNIFEVNAKGENALLNTSNTESISSGVSIANNSNVMLDINLDKDTVIDLGAKTNLNGNNVNLTDNSDDFYELSKVGAEGNQYALKYKDNIATENGYSAELNEIFDASQAIHSKLNEFGYKTVDERAEVLDRYYSANIYSETVKAAYDNVKLNEEAVESLARKSEVGKWTAEGKALYSKNEYDRTGTVRDYSSEIESTGLMAAFGYGVNETTTAGIAFSGVKQDVDTDTGSADADLFYLGVYGNKVVGNYDFTAGLGYQFGEYDTDNNILGTTGDKYDSQALSGYVQGRYTADLGDGLSVQPKVKLGYTYVEQDDAKDSYFGVSDAEISTFDTEVGIDVVKTVQLEKSKADVKFGVSYIKAMGDTDEEFTGRFYGTETSKGFDVLGAEIAENTVKFNLGAEVTNENGFFYNGGFTYEFGSDDTEVYGVNVGVGYRF